MKGASFGHQGDTGMSSPGNTRRFRPRTLHRRIAGLLAAVATVRFNRENQQGILSEAEVNGQTFSATGCSEASCIGQPPVRCARHSHCGQRSLIGVA
jgi:hypothetical protein